MQEIWMQDILVGFEMVGTKLAFENQTIWILDTILLLF